MIIRKVLEEIETMRIDEIKSLEEIEMDVLLLK